MIVSLSIFERLILKAKQVFVLVELSPGKKIYLSITKSTIKEYIKLTTSDAVFSVTYENDELFIGHREN